MLMMAASVDQNKGADKTPPISNKCIAQSQIKNSINEREVNHSPFFVIKDRFFKKTYCIMRNYLTHSLRRAY